MKKHVVRLFSHAISDTSIVGILNKSIIVVVENSSLAVYFASSLSVRSVIIDGINVPNGILWRRERQ